MLDRVREQLESQHLDLVLTDDAKVFLGTRGYDPELGARPLRRAIQRLLEDPLSERVLLGEFKAGTHDPRRTRRRERRAHIRGGRTTGSHRSHGDPATGDGRAGLTVKA